MSSEHVQGQDPNISILCIFVQSSDYVLFKKTDYAFTLTILHCSRTCKFACFVYLVDGISAVTLLLCVQAEVSCCFVIIMWSLEIRLCLSSISEQPFVMISFESTVCGCLLTWYYLHRISICYC